MCREGSEQESMQYGSIRLSGSHGLGRGGAGKLPACLPACLSCRSVEHSLELFAKQGMTMSFVLFCVPSQRILT